MMHALVGLPGVAGGRIDRAPYFHSVTEAMNWLRTERACTAAADNGATTIWRDDDGNWHCAFHRNCIELDHTIVSHKKDVHAWLKVWLPNITR